MASGMPKCLLRCKETNMTANETPASELPQSLLEILVCPVDKTKVYPEGTSLVCRECGRAYPVLNGIPHMIADEAVTRSSGTAHGSGT